MIFTPRIHYSFSFFISCKLGGANSINSKSSRVGEPAFNLRFTPSANESHPIGWLFQFGKYKIKHPKIPRIILCGNRLLITAPGPFSHQTKSGVDFCAKHTKSKTKTFKTYKKMLTFFKINDILNMYSRYLYLSAI